MGLVQDIQKRIRAKETEVVEIENKIRNLEIQREAAKAYIQGLQDILPKVQRDEGTNGGTRQAEFRKGSAPELVQQLLRKTAKPLHINQILEGLGRPVEKKTRLTLAGTLSRCAREHLVFRKVAPNTFGLIELETAADQLPAGDELPEEFGK